MSGETGRDKKRYGDPMGPNTAAISRVAIAAQSAARALGDPSHPNQLPPEDAAFKELEANLGVK